MNRSKQNFIKEEELFYKGLNAFNRQEYYDAHEYWEELWLNYKLKDAKCIQGLIQLAVSYFHFYNDNIKGAKSMALKCLAKFENYKINRGIDINLLVMEIESLLREYDCISDCSMRVKGIKIKVIHE